MTHASRSAHVTILLAVLGAASVRADTLGHLLCTPMATEFAVANPSGAARVVVARTQSEWGRVWGEVAGVTGRNSVDFDQNMVVGVVNGSTDDRVVYRIQLDNAAHPKTLEVHLGSADSLCGARRTHTKTGAHFVVTPRSALPVHFVADEMIDGSEFLFFSTGEGVRSKDVGTIAANTERTTGKAAAWREDAESAVVAALAAIDRNKLLVGPLGRTMKRIPHGWTDLDVTLDKGRWMIRYDDLVFEVDAATGRVTKK